MTRNVHLTATERAVLLLIADGLTAPEIGKTIFSSESTVKTHIARIRLKLDARNIAAIVRQAYRYGLLDNDGLLPEMTPAEKLDQAEVWLADPEVAKVQLARERAALAALEAQP